MKLRLLCLLFLVPLSSCTLYPKYARPQMDSLNTWRVPADETCCTSTDALWWKQFNDPVLDGLVQQALENNQDIKVAIERVNEFIALLGISSSQLYPQIQANGGAERQRISATANSIPPGTSPVGNLYSMILNASYLVDFWGEVRSQVDASYHDLQASIEAQRTVVLTIVTSLASTYIQLRQFDKQLIISQATLKDRQEAYRLAVIRYDLGLTSEIQVEQAISEVESAQVEVENLQIAIPQAENLICVLLGVTSMPIERGLTLDQICMPPKIPSYLPSEIVNQRPDLRAAEQNLIAANARIGVAKAKFFPQFSLVGSFGSESPALSTFLKESSSLWSYGFTVLQEIFTGGRLTSGVKLREAQMRASLHEYLSTILTAFQEVNDALIAHKMNLEIVETLKIRVDALRKYLYLSNLRYIEGQTDYLTFLDAERQVFRAELDFAQAQGNSFVSLINLYQALGGSWVTQADDFANSPTEPLQ